jgi:hypothetical protein
MLIASVVALFLTSGVVLLESQRRRESVSGAAVASDTENPIDRSEGGLVPGA